MEIRFEQVTKTFGQKKILNAFSHTFQSGAPVCLMAPSGEGKTTVLRLAAGLLRPDVGQVVCTKQNPLFSFVFQEDRLLPAFSAADNLRLVWGETDRAHALEALAAVGITEAEAQGPLSALSGGMRRRVALARAVEAPGDALLMDEPFTGMDDDTRKKAAAYVVRRLGGRVLLCATHDTEDAALLGADILRLPEVD